MHTSWALVPGVQTLALPICRQHAGLARLDVRDLRAGNAHRVFIADDFIDNAVPDHFDLRVLEEPFLHDLFRAEMIAAMDDGDFRGEVREEERFFNGGEIGRASWRERVCESV